MGVDSTSIEDEVGHYETCERSALGLGWQRMLMLFVIFMFVCSDFFIKTVLGAVPGATSGRETTNRGVVVQGVSLVLCYVIIINLAAGNVL